MTGWRLPLMGLLAVGLSVTAATPDRGQLEAVQSEIGRLEARLVELDREASGARREEARLEAELELAEARVLELELQLDASREAVERLRDEAEALGTALEVRREGLRRQVEIVALLGRPASVELMADAVRGGQLERALGTLEVLTEGQSRLVEEYGRLRRERSERLADLSRALEEARKEAVALVARREELSDVKRRVEERRRSLERQRRSADDRLAEMRDREQALERLMNRLTESDRLSGTDDIRRFRGALPWPAEGPIVRDFGRHYLPKYSTYTINNGLRLDVAGGEPVIAVYPGIVAFARFFKGYGNMVVLDHGHGVYSLVAGLATIHVRLDQKVTMGTRLGLASPPTDEGNLYFEIRVDDEPLDPVRWLTLEEGATR